MRYGTVAEGFVLLFLIPLGIFIVPIKIPLLPILLSAAVYACWRCRGRVDYKKSFGRPAKGWWKPVVVRGFGVAVFSLLFCSFFQPELLFDFPRHRPKLWALVLCLYPILSVLPQEVIYRLYFFEVVASGRGGKYVKILVGTFLFSWVHIIYHNAFALGGTLFAGCIFNWIYWRYRDEQGVMWRVIAEHSLYGLIIFTVGLGSFFFLAN